jgi:hypothetical protein
VRAELDTVVAVLARRRAALVNVGHGRDEGSSRRAALFASAWTARGGEVGAVVSWPSAAASWLRPARRLAAGTPDLWVVADEPAGWSGLVGRLAGTGAWRPDRTVAFSGLGDPGLPLLVGRQATEGMCGAFADGGLWWFACGLLHVGDVVPA